MSRSLAYHCDTNFNDRNKVIFETLLCHALVSRYTSVFSAVINKVSLTLAADFTAVRQHLMQARDTDASEAKAVLSVIAQGFVKELHAFEDFSVFYPGKRGVELLSAIIDELSSKDSKRVYRQLAIHRAYFMVFIQPDKSPSDVCRQSVDHEWSVLDWRQYFRDTHALMGKEFHETVRVRRQKSRHKLEKRVGIMDETTFRFCLTREQQRALLSMPEHTRGMDVWRVTPRSRFVHDGMYKHNMPQLCGPSGTVALRLGLALQSGLTKVELKQFAFYVSMFTVAVGAHSMDEVFSIGVAQGISDYRRGNYASIFTDALNLPALAKAEIADLSRRYLRR